MNDAARHYTNTPLHFGIDGRLDAEFPVSWSELAEDLIAHDRMTEKNGCRETVIETHYWNGENFIMPYISEKFPIYTNDKVCIGTTWNAKALHDFSLLKYAKQQKPSVIQTKLPTELFTRAEQLIAFYALQRYSRKEIAKELNLSLKTIDHKLDQLYQKTDTHSLLQFINYCEGNKLDNFIPYDLVVKGIRFI